MPDAKGLAGKPTGPFLFLASHAFVAWACHPGILKNPSVKAGWAGRF